MITDFVESVVEVTPMIFLINRVHGGELCHRSMVVLVAKPSSPCSTRSWQFATLSWPWHWGWLCSISVTVGHVLIIHLWLMLRDYGDAWSHSPDLILQTLCMSICYVRISAIAVNLYYSLNCLLPQETTDPASNLPRITKLLQFSAVCFFLGGGGQ
jgi:hypothetical protein